MTDLLAPLNQDQLTLLSFMAGAYLRDGDWPIWHHVLTELDRKGLDAAEIIRTLPELGRALGGPSYGLAWYDHMLPEDGRPTLTVAAAYHVQELQKVTAEPFIRLLRFMVDRQLNAPSSPQQVSRTVISPDVLWSTVGAAGGLGVISDDLMARIPGILKHEPPTWGVINSWVPDNPLKWSGELRREILKYRDVSSLEEYVERVTKQMPDQGHAVTQYFSPATPLAPSSGRAISRAQPSYVDSGLVEELEAKQADGSTTWKLDKLLQLIHELNDNFSSDNPYACHALLRAILDHVPPVFGRSGFDEVVNNHKWSQTDRVYVKKLAEFRTSAHDVMHRQIRKSAGVITMHDVPSRAYVNALLRVVVDEL